MSRAGNITISILMWCAIAVYVVASFRYADRRRTAITVETLRIAIVDTTASRVVTSEKVMHWLQEARIDPTGRPIDSTDTRSIERLLADRPEVRRASAWTDLSGTLTVRIEPRTPAMRVRTSGGYRFWLTGDGVIIRDRGDLAAYVPVVTGNIAFPFSPSAEGSYIRMQADNYNDFLERFTALRAEREDISSRLASIRAEERIARASSPKRWWSRSRKEAFGLAKNARLADLEARRSETAASLGKIDKLERSLRENEKKTYQSFRFLSKLANFVGFIERDHFWAAQIVQIHATSGGNSNGNGNGGVDGASSNGEGGGGSEWREPQLELIPRAGDHIILLGELDGSETQRLENLRLFYLEGLRYEGWDRYGYINIKYRNQIVCTK